MIVSVPLAIPVTIPVLPTIASEGLLLLHVPPTTLSVKLLVLPPQIVVAPVIVPGSGKAEMVMVTEVKAVSVPSFILILKLSVPL